MKQLTIGLLFTLTAPVTLPAEDQPFVSLTFKQARAKAKKENKAVFIDFYTTWCGPCKMLDDSTLKDKKVIALLKNKTIPLK
ncbi:MAG: thioredoxin family protein, partial [Planctomycetota bacterium]